MMGNNPEITRRGIRQALDKICRAVYELAAMDLTIQEMAVDIGVDESWLKEQITNPGSVVYAAYYKGKVSKHRDVFEMLMKSIQEDRNINAIRHYDFAYRQKTVMAPVKPKEDVREVVVTVKYEAEPIDTDNDEEAGLNGEKPD